MHCLALRAGIQQLDGAAGDFHGATQTSVSEARRQKFDLELKSHEEVVQLGRENGQCAILFRKRHNFFNSKACGNLTIS